jgi:3-phenylpropionate/trans-cinnamate dioxygenase ferredoxin subunit
MTATTWHRAAALSAVADDVPVAVQLDDGTRLCLVRDGDAILAFEDRCPHRDFALSGGDLVAPGVIECPWHGARFDCRTGRVLQGPATDDLCTVAVRVDGDDVLVATRP